MVERYTKACNPTFDIRFKELKEKHPELVLKMVNEAEGQCIQSTQSATIDIIVKDYKDVLAMLKVDVSEWYDSTDIDHLHRLICNEEHRLLDDYGIPYTKVKALFNTEELKSIKDKAQALSDLKQSMLSKRSGN